MNTFIDAGEECLPFIGVHLKLSISREFDLYQNVIENAWLVLPLLLNLNMIIFLIILILL